MMYYTCTDVHAQISCTSNTVNEVFGQGLARSQPIVDASDDPVQYFVGTPKTTDSK